MPIIEIPDFYQSFSIPKLPDTSDSYTDSLEDEQSDSTSNKDNTTESDDNLDCNDKDKD